MSCSGANFQTIWSHVVEVDGVDEVGVGAFEVHHVADHQRLPLLPSERARGHGPGNLQLVGILGVDLAQLAVADPAVASQRQHPLIGVLGIFLQGFVGTRDPHDRAAEYDSQAQPFRFRFMRFIVEISFSILFGRWPARGHQIEASSLYVLVNVNDVVFAEEAGPGRHALFFAAFHGDGQKLLLLHPGDGTPQIRPKLAARRIGSMAAIAVRVVELIAMEDVLGDLGTLAVDKQRESPTERLCRPSACRRTFRFSLTWPRIRLRQDPLRDLRPLRIRQIGMRRHPTAAVANFRSQLGWSVRLPGIALGHVAVGGSHHLVIHGVTGGAVACLDQLLGRPVPARQGPIASDCRMSCCLSFEAHQHAALRQYGREFRLVLSITSSSLFFNASLPSRTPIDMGKEYCSGAPRARVFGTVTTSKSG